MSEAQWTVYDHGGGRFWVELDERERALLADTYTKEMTELVAEALTNRRAPVTPIPVSEPPGDEAVVVLVRIHGEESSFDWLFSGIPVVWREVASASGPYEFDPTHYLLLRKGE